MVGSCSFEHYSIERSQYCQRPINHGVKTGLNIIGKQVRRLRYQRGMSQPELAAMCQRLGWDIERDTIAKIEATSRWVGDHELLKLAGALEVPLDALFAPSDRKALTRKRSARL